MVCFKGITWETTHGSCVTLITLLSFIQFSYFRSRITKIRRCP